jgi:hypothetical protein
MVTLRCVECGLEADEDAAGWRAYLGHDPREDEEPVVVTYCPDCARREFGDPADRPR